jgi:hypothetical protein
MPTAELAREWESESPIIEAGWADPPDGCEAPVKTRPKVSISALDQELEKEIEQAALKLEKKWDGEGSQGYSKDTFERAVAFLTSHAAYLKSMCGISPPTPRIGSGPDGSIDLHWKRKTWELLVNIPADPAQMAVFYGDDYGVQKIKGSLNPKTFNLGIVTWLMN